jgi:phage terminase small subunit
LTYTKRYVISQVMGVPKQLTEKQMKFAELLVYNEGRITGTEAARQAGYEPERARTTAAELRNPNKFPLVAKYIGELREEVQKKYEVTFENHITELARLRDESKNKGAWSAAINAEVARGKAAGLYIDQKIIKYGSLDSLTPAELEAKMKQILEDNKNLLVEADFNIVNENQIEEHLQEEHLQTEEHLQEDNSKQP